MINLQVCYLLIGNSGGGIWAYCVVIHDHALTWIDDQGNKRRGEYDRIMSISARNPNAYRLAVEFMHMIINDKYLLPKHLHAKYIPTYDYPQFVAFDSEQARGR